MVKLLEVNITIMRGPIGRGSAGIFDFELSTLCLQRFTNDSLDFPTWHWCPGQNQLSVSAPGSTIPCICLSISINSLTVVCPVFPSFVGSKSCSSFYVFRKRVTMTSFLHENQKLAVLCMSPHGSLSSCNKLGRHYPPPLLCQTIDL